MHQMVGRRTLYNSEKMLGGTYHGRLHREFGNIPYKPEQHRA